ncbi:MAG TPA: metal-sensitive transcriptional regulator [Gemmatimonadota bacterium]|nr:metal-sensitive transcriptional regulator [Gemmatimonadota bacterium]
MTDARTQSQAPERGYQRSRHAALLKNRLKRIEGQVRGVQRMVEEGRYCVDILTQIDAVTAALARVQDEILESHLNYCVTDALEGNDPAESREKVDEVVTLLKKFRRTRS